MCGIIGYTGKKQAAPILLEGLSKLEYRGYDSAGIAVRDNNKAPTVVKSKGKLKYLSEKTLDGASVKGSCGIGHTRWATHGEPSEINAHPHMSDDGNVVGVHNGIIENFSQLRDKLTRKGYSFYSETDTEVLIKTVDYYYKKYKMGPQDALAKTVVRIRGSYALAVMFKDYPDEIYVARKDSPMIIGTAKGENFLASDVPAILPYTRSVYYMNDMEFAKLTKDSIEFYNIDGDRIEKEVTEIAWDAEAADRSGFEHFMIKEIHEQPKVINDTLSAYIKDGNIDLCSVNLTSEDLKKISKITIIGCGSAYHVGMCAYYTIGELAQIPVEVDLASEYRYRNVISTPGELVIVISQSGETADSLAALRKANDNKLNTLAIVNVMGSSISREAGHVMYTMAGPEIAVATTKAYSTQLVALDILAIEMAKARGCIDDDTYRGLLDEIAELPDKVTKVIDDKERIQWFASKFSGAQDALFIGRLLDYAIGLEGSLKMKEVSYIHSEAYAAGELKHGTISLVEENTLVIGVITQEQIYEKTVSNLVEVKSRGAYLMAIAPFGKYELEDLADFVTYIPKTLDIFYPILACVPLQLFAYYLSVSKGLDVDKPRNLAKSVTVE